MTLYRHNIYRNQGDRSLRMHWHLTVKMENKCNVYYNKNIIMYMYIVAVKNLE